MVTLSHVASIFVPSTVDIDKAIDNSGIVRSILAQLSEKFGGASATQVQGAWLSDTAGLVVENVTRIFCYATERETLHDVFFNLAEELKVEMSQDAVLIDIDNVGYLV